MSNNPYILVGRKGEDQIYFRPLPYGIQIIVGEKIYFATNYDSAMRFIQSLRNIRKREKSIERMIQNARENSTTDKK